VVAIEGGREKVAMRRARSTRSSLAKRWPKKTKEGERQKKRKPDDDQSIILLIA